MNNKKLFEIRKIKFKDIKLKNTIIPLLLVGLLLGVVVLKLFQNSNFINKFHKDEIGNPITQYKPMNKPNKGLYGKVDYYLEMARSQGDNDTEITAENLNRLFPALTFSYSSDTASVNYLVSTEEVRLVGFNVDSIRKQSATAKDTMINFYNNSIFKSLIERQSINLSRKYFIITWSKDKKHIKSIKIDPTLGDVPLLNDNWKGEILLDDPFSKIGTNVVYLIKDNMPLPLFSSNLSIESFRNHDTNGYDTVFVENWNAKLISEYEQMYRNQTNRQPVNISFTGGEHIRFLNTGTQIYIQPYNLNVQIFFNGKDTIINDQTTALLPQIDNVLKIRLMNVENRAYLDQVLYLSKTPFNIASKLSNGARIHINKVYADLSSFQQIVHLESNIKERDSIKQVELTNNIFLSKILEDRIKYWVDSLYTNRRWHKNDEYQISICLMDISTGEIIAAPFYSNRLDSINIDVEAEVRNYNLENHHIGSTFKPLLAFAAVAKYPNLSQFRLTSANFINKDSCSMLGYTIPSYGKAADGNRGKNIFWNVGEHLNRQYFLAYSHDNYPIAMAMLALTEPTGNDSNYRDAAAFNMLATNWNNQRANNLHNLLGNNGVRLRYYPKNNVARKILFNDTESNNVDLAESSFANLMSNLYNIKTIDRDTIMLYSDKYTWRLLNKIPLGLSTLFSDIVNLRWENVKNFIDFENLILGQGDNFWNNVKLAEAYSRLLSKRKVEATFVKNSNQAARLFENPTQLFNYRAPFIQQKTEESLNNAWTAFMNDWERAAQENSEHRTPQDGNTLNDAYYEFRQSFANTDNDLNDYHYYCKTGTPEEEGKIEFNTYLNARDRNGHLIPIYYDAGVFVFGITRNEAQPRGIVGVVYIKHISESKPNGRNGVESSTARDFFTSALYRKIMFYNQNRFK